MTVHGPRWALTAITAALLVSFWNISSASAAAAPVGLGTAGSFSVLGGSAITNTGASTLSGDLGLSPGSAISGFPPGLVAGATHTADAQAAQARSDLTIAYNDAASRAPDASVAGDLVGRTLLPGVYNSAGTLAVTGALTLDGQGNPASVFIIQIASTLTTGSASTINVINGAQACNIYWQVGSSATLGTGSSFKGTIMALTSITVTTGTTVQGRALARNGAVTLDTNAFTTPACAPVVPTTTPTATASPTPTPTPSATSTVVARPSTPRTTAKASTRPVASKPTSNTGVGTASRTATSAVSATQVGQPVVAGTTPEGGGAFTSQVPESHPTPVRTTGQLAQTGAKPPLVLGISLLAAGVTMLAFTRRRGAHS